MAILPARSTATAALLAAVLSCAAPAAAETKTLARGAMDLVGTPLDLALSPYTVTSTFVRKYYVTGKGSPLEKALLTPVTGLVYGCSCLMTTGAVTFMRFADGLVNVPMGLAMLGSEKEPDTALFEPDHGAKGALVDYRGIYFGGYYCEGFFP